MSMKRTKQRSSGSSRAGEDDEDAAWAKPAGPEPTWGEVESKAADAFIPFALSSRYTKGDFISHPKFGRGLVVGVEGARIEVLFQDGKKKLGHALAGG